MLWRVGQVLTIYRGRQYRGQLPGCLNFWVAIVVLGVAGCGSQGSRPSQAQAKAGVLTETQPPTPRRAAVSVPPEGTSLAGTVPSPAPRSITPTPATAGAPQAITRALDPPDRLARPTAAPSSLLPPPQPPRPAAALVGEASAPQAMTVTVGRTPPAALMPQPVNSSGATRNDAANAPTRPMMPPPEAPRASMPPPAMPAPQPAIRPPAVIPPKRYEGPRLGTTTWSGQIEKGGVVTIDGKLPGVPVMIDLDTKEFAVVEAPSPANGWNRMVIRSKNRRHTVISIQWTVL